LGVLTQNRRRRRGRGYPAVVSQTRVQLPSRPPPRVPGMADARPGPARRGLPSCPAPSGHIPQGSFGMGVGTAVGTTCGTFVGTAVGTTCGTAVGTTCGTAVGTTCGTAVGTTCGS